MATLESDYSFTAEIVPSPLGIGSAYEAIGSVAAPLFAGFSLTLTTLVIATADIDTRWRDAVVVSFVLASLAFIMCVQAAFWARGFSSSRADALDWWPDNQEPARQRLIHQELLRNRARWRIWATREAWLYRIGLVTLLGGFGLLLIPKGHIDPTRWVVLSLAAVVLLMELIWMCSASLAGWGMAGEDNVIGKIVRRLTP